MERCGGPAVCNICRREFEQLVEQCVGAQLTIRRTCEHAPPDRVLVRWGHRRNYMEVTVCGTCGMIGDGDGFIDAPELVMLMLLRDRMIERQRDANIEGAGFKPGDTYTLPIPGEGPSNG